MAGENFRKLIVGIPAVFIALVLLAGILLKCINGIDHCRWHNTAKDDICSGGVSGSAARRRSCRNPCTALPNCRVPSAKKLKTPQLTSVVFFGGLSERTGDFGDARVLGKLQGAGGVVSVVAARRADSERLQDKRCDIAISQLAAAVACTHDQLGTVQIYGKLAGLTVISQKTFGCAFSAPELVLKKRVEIWAAASSPSSLLTALLIFCS